MTNACAPPRPAVSIPGAHEVTPQRLFLESAARDRFTQVGQACSALAEGAGIGVVRAYSVKTNPRVDMLTLARGFGFFAEVISADERAAAREAGFPADHIIYNGPQPVSATADGEPLAYCFADSVEALGRNISLAVCEVPGIRLRPAMIGSRFGIPLEEDDLLERVVTQLDVTRVACSLHARREDFHGTSWLNVCSDIIARAARLERVTGCKVVAFDAGGGWQPHEFDQTFDADSRALAARVRESLPNVTRLIFEPGQAIATPAEALIVSVVEVRRRGARREVIVDAGYNDWPQQHAFAHRMYIARRGHWESLGVGGDRLGGKTCLEYDIVDGLRFPDNVDVGDRLLIADVGAYDASMAFSFARANAGLREVQRQSA